MALDVLSDTVIEVAQTEAGPNPPYNGQITPAYPVVCNVSGPPLPAPPCERDFGEEILHKVEHVMKPIYKVLIIIGIIVGIISLLWGGYYVWKRYKVGVMVGKIGERVGL